MDEELRAVAEDYDVGLEIFRSNLEGKTSFIVDGELTAHRVPDQPMVLTCPEARIGHTQDKVSQLSDDVSHVLLSINKENEMSTRPKRSPSWNQSKSYD